MPAANENNIANCDKNKNDNNDNNNYTVINKY